MERTALTSVTGTQTISVSPSSIRHTVSVEGTGTVTVTVKPHLLTQPQAPDNNSIDLSAPKPLVIEGSFDQLIFTPASDSDTYSLSVVSV